MPNESVQEVPALAVLLGSNVKSWPYTEETLVHALQLRSQQEQTKRQYYKLENVNRSLELLKTAVSAGIPAGVIPQLFNNDGSSGKAETADTHRVEHAKEQSPLTAAPDKQLKTYKFPPGNPSIKTHSADSEVRTHRRTHSPARIGAEAVAALNNSMVLREKESHNNEEAGPKTPTPQTSTHQRVMSMPIHLKNESTTGVLNFSAWHTYNGQNHVSNQQGSGRKPIISSSSPSSNGIRKHRRPNTTNSAFGVIDLNSINQVSYKQSHSRSRSVNETTAVHNTDSGSNPGKIESKVEKTSNPSSVEGNDDTFSESSSNGVASDDIRKTAPPPPPQILLKGPNYADNLLNT
ncbi:unnamed protein product [Kluyveromyces dobzhanskii CBS 2104]|uniref:WGS project CCBQ000000000 data, contig 00015 n=1 Tax=Kluyveromyces dobzhanskii CBS 2104 TaxID=1427455 RepID=A0A0A8L9A4_9SACH|nr:unnamed protein product [Kluyveromyces dobzhanskii CBS 2104]